MINLYLQNIREYCFRLKGIYGFMLTVFVGIPLDLQKHGFHVVKTSKSHGEIKGFRA